MNRRVATSGGVLAGVLLSVLAGCAEEATGEGDEGDRVEAVTPQPDDEATDGEGVTATKAPSKPAVVVRPQNDGRLFDSQNNSQG